MSAYTHGRFMALFVLKEGFRVVTTEKGGRVVHVRTGDELALSAVEVQLLARATAGGVDTEDASVQPIFKKLANLGLLVKGVGPAPAKTSSFDELSLEVEPEADKGPALPPGPLPRFRSEVLATRRDGSTLYDLNDEASGQKLSLHDFELSLSRMLDGKRSAAEVIEACKRLGIPVTGESLARFIEHVSRAGFLAPHGSSAPVGKTPGPERQQWDPNVRKHYQTGLRLNREGRHAESILAFELALRFDPTNREARDALNTVRLQIAQIKAEAEEFDVSISDSALRQRPEGLSPAALAQPPLPTAQPEPAAVVVSVPAAVVVPEPVLRLEGQKEEAAPVARPTRSLRSLVVSVTTVGVALAVGWFAGSRFGANTTSEAPTAPQAATAVVPRPTAPTAPRADADAGMAEALAAVVDAGTAELVLPVDAGRAAVDAGSLADTAPVPPSPADAGSPVAAAPVPDAPVDAGAQPVSAGVVTAEQPAGGWLKANIRKRGRVTMGTIDAPSSGRVTWTTPNEREVKKGAVVGFVSASGRRVDLTAPKAGLLMPKVADGSKVNDGDSLATIAYTEGFIQSTVDLATPYANWACEVLDKTTGRKAPCKVVSATAKGNGLFVTATTEPLWFDDCASPELHVGEAR